MSFITDFFFKHRQTMMSSKTDHITTNLHSDYIVYVDENGDHGMQNLDPNYPVFVLAFCIFHKRYYSDHVVCALHDFKFRHFGHDLVVLHEHDIRKEKGLFTFKSKEQKTKFLNELSQLIQTHNFILVSCVIDKSKLKGLSDQNENPYHLALGFCLETLYEFLQEKNQHEALTHIVFECRGKREDDELELEFRRMTDGANRLGINFPFEIIFADKKVDSPGLQLADLVARPIGLNILRPDQSNSAFEVLKEKFYCEAGRQNVGKVYQNWGLKVYPPQKSEKPR